MPDETASPEAPQQQPQGQGVPPELVLNILQQRAQRDKELALHLEAAVLQAANQMQQVTIQQLLEEQPEPAPAKPPAKKRTTKK